MNVAFVNPPMFLNSYKYFPTGLGYLAGALMRERIPFSFYDFQMNRLKIKDFLQQVNKNAVPDLFAITGFLTSFQSVQKICEVIKNNFPKSKIVVGGKIAVVNPEILFKYLQTDFIIHGEGEVALIQLIKAMRNQFDYEKVQGLSYKSINGDILVNGEADLINNISDYSIPYEKFDMRSYVNSCNIQSPNTPSINLISSRGCPFSCTFCNNSKGKKSSMRYYETDTIFNSLDYLISNFGLKHVTFNDDIFGVNKKQRNDICLKIKERKLSFSISTRLDYLDEESINLLSDSGCHYLCVGIESPSMKVSKIIDKKLDIEKFQKNIDLLKKSKIVVNYGFMFGYLGETKETINETRDFVLKNKILYSAFFANAFPQTKLYDMVKDKIGDEEIYLRKLFRVDLSRDYLINMTDIPTWKLFHLRDSLVIDSVLNTINFHFPIILLKPLGILYLFLMRKIGLNLGIIKRLFEYININIIKPMAKK